MINITSPRIRSLLFFIPELFGGVFWYRFIELCMETPCLCHLERHQHGCRKVTETSVVELCINISSSARLVQLAKSKAITHFYTRGNAKRWNGLLVGTSMGKYVTHLRGLRCANMSLTHSLTFQTKMHFTQIEAIMKELSTYLELTIELHQI